MADWNFLRRRKKTTVKLATSEEAERKSFESKDFEHGTQDEVFKVVLFLVALISIAYWGLSHSPRPKLAESTPQHTFSSERALSHVKVLATDIGYRVVGSRGLEQGQRYIMDQLEQILNRKEGADVANNLEAVIEKQTVNGTYRIKLQSLGNFTFHTVYTDIENVIMRIQPKYMYPTSRNAVLVNCHVDSAVGSPGASDDAAGCGVMLELVNNIISGSLKLNRPVIFLFNGAEEPVLDGAHGFVAQHRWAKDIAVLLNLESSGSGGLALLFRSGPKNGWLTRVFAKSVKRPHGSSVSQDFFDADLVPAETDFRVFWEEGNIPGIDLANYMNGQTYHTPRDATDRVTLETLQHMGETAYSLLLELAVKSNVIDDAQNDIKMQNERVIFHDLLGLYTFIYSEYMGNIMFWLVWLISICLCIRTVQSYIGWDIFFHCLLNIWISIFVAFTAALFLGYLLSVSYTRAMVWYHRNSVAYFIFAPLMTCVFLYLLNNRSEMTVAANKLKKDKEEEEYLSVISKLTRQRQSEAFIVVHIFMEWIILSCLLYFRLSSVYLYACRFVCLYIPIALLKGPVFWLAANVFLPIMGRAGVDVMGDIVASIFVALVWIPCILIPLTPTWSKYPKFRNYCYYLSIFVTLSSMLALLLGVFHPYDGMNAPKRVIYHHMMISEKQRVKNALFISSMDRRDIVDASYSDVLVENAKDSNSFRWGWFSHGPWENIEPLGKTCHGVFVEDSVSDHDVPKPSVKVLEQVTNEQGRELLLEFSFLQAHWGSIRWNASLYKWSLEDRLPQPLEDGTVYIRHIGAHDSRKFTVRLYSTNKDAIAMDLTSTHFGAHSQMMPYLESLPNWLPSSVVKRIIKNSLERYHRQVPIEKDALLACSASSTVWITYLTAIATEVMKERKRSTLSVEDIFTALVEVDFGDFVDPLKQFLQEYKEQQSRKKEAKWEQRQAARGMFQVPEGEALDITAETRDPSDIPFFERASSSTGVMTTLSSEPMVNYVSHYEQQQRYIDNEMQEDKPKQTSIESLLN
ncbi:Endoplasmic reticulum metallopeptidase 1 [Galdieria sulphuraria]|nr:Endoplasmic reticulum metallopeptidase 1 [Galdieria sulphuraria]